MVVGYLNLGSIVELQRLIHFLLLSLLLLNLSLVVSDWLGELLVEVGSLSSYSICAAVNLVDLAVLGDELLLLVILVVDSCEVLTVTSNESTRLICELLLIWLHGILLCSAKVVVWISSHIQWLLVLICSLLLELPTLKLVGILFVSTELELAHVHLIELVGHHLRGWLLAVLAWSSIA